MKLVYWSVCSYSKSSGDVVYRRKIWGIVSLASYKFQFSREHENSGVRSM